jgi:hypothetical protein
VSLVGVLKAVFASKELNKEVETRSCFSEAGTFGLGLYYPIISLSNRNCFLCSGFISHNFWLK